MSGKTRGQSVCITTAKPRTNASIAASRTTARSKGWHSVSTASPSRKPVITIQTNQKERLQTKKRISKTCKTTNARAASSRCRRTISIRYVNHAGRKRKHTTKRKRPPGRPPRTVRENKKLIHLYFSGWIRKSQGS